LPEHDAHGGSKEQSVNCNCLIYSKNCQFCNSQLDTGKWIVA
jgi:hypothetical protein